MSPLFQNVEQDFETAVPGAHPKVSRATSNPAKKAAEPAKQATKGSGDGVAVSGPQAVGDKAAQKAGDSLEASSNPPSTPEVSTKSTGARTRRPAQQSSQQQPVAPSNTPMPRSIILLPEPYANWRERLVGLFRALVPDQADGLFTPGYVGQVYVQRPLSESYLVSAKYDVNVRGGSNIRWMRVVEAMVRGMRLDLQRHPITYAPLPVKKTDKAACGIRVQVALKPLAMAHSGL